MVGKKMTKTKQSRVDEVIELLGEKSISYHQNVGGYPAQIQRVGNHIAIADCDENGEPDLEVVTVGKALRKLDSAKQFARANSCSLLEALQEIW
jgi:hypothetical protein